MPKTRSGTSGSSQYNLFSPTADVVALELQSRVTEARVLAVLSKIGHINTSDQAACSKLLGLFLQDVRDDLREEDPDCENPAEKTTSACPSGSYRCFKGMCRKSPLTKGKAIEVEGQGRSRNRKGEMRRRLPLSLALA